MFAVSPYTALVEFSPTDCWDCPIPFSEVLVQYGLMLVLIVAATAMQEARRQFIRGLGFLLTAPLLLWAVVYTSVIPRWGISNSLDVPLENWPRRMSWLFLGSLDLLLLAIVVFGYRRRSAKQQTEPE